MTISWEDLTIKINDVVWSQVCDLNVYPEDVEASLQDKIDNGEFEEMYDDTSIDINGKYYDNNLDVSISYKSKFKKDEMIITKVEDGNTVDVEDLNKGCDNDEY